jgi:Flp pilus assembly protein TadD
MTRAKSVMAAIGTALGTILLVSCGGPQSAGTRDYDGASRLRVAAAAEASGQTDVALSMYASAAAAEPGQADVQGRFATALARSGNTAQAEQVLNRALERRRDDPMLLAQLGRLRLRSGAAAQALEVFGRLLAAAPRNADALEGQGIALDLLGRHAEAEQSHRAALALAPESVGTANNLAMSLLLAGRPEAAAAILEPLARLPRAPPRVIANLAVARAASGDHDGARSLLDGHSGSGDIDAIAAALSRGAEAGRS